MNPVIKLQEVEWQQVPNSGGLQLFNPAFRYMHIEQIERRTRDYSDVYNWGVFCRSTATIHLYFTNQN